MNINPKDAVQSRARAAWNVTRRGTLAMATGSGKSKIAVDRVKELLKEKPKATILLLVPTKRLRDNNWKDEFEKWDAGAEWSRITRSCYVSVNKYDQTAWDLVVMDEAHNITPNNAEFFENNHVKEVLGLTATPPRDVEKTELLDLIAPVCFIYTMDEAVRAKLVAPYEITVFSVPLDKTDKYIKGGTADKPFLTTEAAHYQYLCKRVAQSNFMNDSMKKFSRIARMTFLKSLKSKTEAVRRILDTFTLDERVLVFCGGIAQADLILPGAAYHSKSNAEALNDFIAGEINQLACVAALNEGINIANLDIGLLSTLNSNSKTLIQQVGRVVRLRPDHIARIYILVGQGTVEEEWLEKATEGFDKSKIRYEDMRNVDNKVALVTLKQ